MRGSNRSLYGFRRARLHDASLPFFNTGAGKNPHGEWILEQIWRRAFRPHHLTSILGQIALSRQELVVTWLKSGVIEKVFGHPDAKRELPKADVSPVLLNMLCDGMEQLPESRRRTRGRNADRWYGLSRAGEILR